MAHCHEDDVFQGPYQPGGVTQMVLHKLTGCVIARGSDNLGRYAWQELLLDGMRTLIVITAYCITQESLTGCGHETSAMQQWRKLRARGIDQPKPRQQILDDLTTFVSKHETAGNEVALMMDANSPINDDAIEAFLEAMNLHDLMAEYLPE